RASLRAMALAVSRLRVSVAHVLIDGNQEIPLDISQTPIVSGDAKSASIAAASIVAKVARDRFMLRMDRKFPQYGFARHKGYPTRDHIEALRRHGPCPLHRRTFSGVRTG
ncbi:MAG: ribonuclease HII, partial [bacterium]|nr:ribonuclease HII [bacterium]